MLKIAGITRQFDRKTVLHGVDLDVAHGEIVCLLGPSGCGKTTLLRIIAGLERPDTGDIILEGRAITHDAVHTRDFGLMFQDFALFPHKNVEQNIAFGLRMRGLSAGEQRKTVSEMLEIVGLKGFEKRDVSELSGGEKQRVALARSLAPQPRLLMLDEPLGSLDASLRERLVMDLRDIIKRLRLTAIYVTHDQQEAFAIADRIALMNNGVIEQVDSPEVVYTRPRTIFAAQFLGLNNIVTILSWEKGQAQTILGSFPVDRSAKAILIHPGGITLKTEQTQTAVYTVRGILKSRVFQGDSYQLKVDVDNSIELVFKYPLVNFPIPVINTTLTLQFSIEFVIPLW
ncbi:MAG: ABC transporter ATP-binding protein [Chitinophagaceae bacterium]|nr:ABC transporter ATP-binding protein [Anaerolineae bacterium]